MTPPGVGTEFLEAGQLDGIVTSMRPDSVPIVKRRRGVRRPRYRPFDEARNYMHRLGVETVAEFRRWSAGELPGKAPKPSDIPSNPHQVYRAEWAGYSDFLGTGRVATYRREFLPFAEARTFARALNLDRAGDWPRYCSGEIVVPGMSPRPDNVPSDPRFTYRTTGWAGMKDWLGLGAPVEVLPSKFVPFEDARRYARSLKLNSWQEWRAFVESGDRPSNIPAVPHAAYRGLGFTNYADWLGCATVAFHQVTWAPYAEALALVQPLGLKNVAQWRSYCRGDRPDLPPKPTNIPSNPDRVYAPDGFRWRDWFSTRT